MKLKPHDALRLAVHDYMRPKYVRDATPPRLQFSAKLGWKPRVEYLTALWEERLVELGDEPERPVELLFRHLVGTSESIPWNLRQLLALLRPFISVIPRNPVVHLV